MHTTTVWLTGAKSGLGKALKPLLHENLDLKILETDKEVDVTDEEEVLLFADLHKPDIIINTAAISDPKECEADMVKAFKVNALGARNLAEASRRHNSVLIQISSDDIFEGNQGDSFIEFDTPVPLSVYAKSKLAAEDYVKELSPKHIIIRSSWVYGMPKPGDFFHQVIDAAKNGTVLPVPTTQISTPTSADSLAGFVLKLIESPSYGTFHASDEGSCTRYEFAKEILDAYHLPADCIEPVEGKTSRTALENLMMKMQDLYAMPEWKEDLHAFAEKRPA